MFEREVAGYMYDYYCGVNSDIANLIDSCCCWDQPGALKKIKYWLSYGIKHNGDYMSCGGRVRVNGVYNISVDSLKKAMYMFENYMEKFGDEIVLTKF